MTSLESLLSDVLDVATAEFADDAGRDTLPAWTSLRHIQIVNAVEETYALTLTTYEIQHMTTVGRLREILRAKGISV